MKATLTVELPDESHKLRVFESAPELADVIIDIDNLCSVALHLPLEQVDAMGTLQEVRDLIDNVREILE